MTQGPACSTVTGRTSPFESNSCVMPTFLPRMPVTFVAISISMPSAARRFRSDDYWLGSADAHAGAAALGRPVGASPRPRLLVLFPKSLDLHIHARGQIELHQRID